MDLLATGGAGCAPYSNTSGNGTHCPKQSDDEYTTAFALWALTQSPLVVATDIRQLSGVMRTLMLNPEIIALHQSTRTPPGVRLGTNSDSNVRSVCLTGNCLCFPVFENGLNAVV